MEEIEAKILNINREEVEKNLISLGAKKVFDDDLLAIFFDFQDNSIKDNKKTVRLRREGNKTFLTFKSKISNDKIKIMEEIETEVMDFDKTKKILESLGLLEYETTKKRRVSYKLGNVRFELDNYSDDLDFIPEFLEIEATVEEIYKYAELLGFKKEDCKPWSFFDLKKNYSIQTNLS
jgi:adenylate cyclase class 2